MREFGGNEVYDENAGGRRREGGETFLQARVDAVADGGEIGEAKAIALIAAGEVEGEEVGMLRCFFPESLYLIPLAC